MTSPSNSSADGGTTSIRPHLRLHERLAYSVGHFYNDLCASMWFSYLLIYLHYILKFRNTYAGYLLLLGQIVDAISTPLIGSESDQVAGFFKYTKRKSWHLIGTVLVTISFPFLFLKCIGVENADDWAQLIYYAPFVTIFQIGWASTQIAHMALVNEISFDESERVGLNAYRNAFTLLSSVVVYGIACGLFVVDANAAISESDTTPFMILALSVVGIGLIFSILFHIFTPERKFTEHAAASKKINQQSTKIVDMTWLDWLKEWQFYLVAFAYMLSRLVANVSQTYWPLYLTESLELSKIYIAIIPLAVFVTGFFTSLIMRPVNRILGRKLTFGFGVAFTGAACTWMWFLSKGSAMQVFGPAVLLGAGSSTLLVTSLSMVADLIGPHTAACAFVYGSMSFADKLSSGAALVLVQHFHPCNAVGTTGCCPACSWYYRTVMVFLPAAFAGTCLVFLLVMIPIKIGNLRKFTRNQSPQGKPEDLEAPGATVVTGFKRDTGPTGLPDPQRASGGSRQPGSAGYPGQAGVTGPKGPTESSGNEESPEIPGQADTPEATDFSVMQGASDFVGGPSGPRGTQGHDEPPELHEDQGSASDPESQAPQGPAGPQDPGAVEHVGETGPTGVVGFTDAVLDESNVEPDERRPRCIEKCADAITQL